MSAVDSRAIYIDPPTIPAGMSVDTYRKVRALERSRKVRGFRRISARKMVVWMRVFMQNEQHPDHSHGLSATVSVDFCNYRAELQGEHLGTFDSLDEAKAAITERMRTRFNLIPADTGKPVVWMYERSYGYKYGEGGKLDTAAIAKLIRGDIKTAVSEGLLPDRWAYSVKTERYSGGSSIDVRVKNCADAWMPCPGYKVGTRRDHEDGGWTATGCGNPWCKASNPDKAGAQEHDVLTEEATAAKMTLERIHNAYNHDGSDSMVDYFDVNYYGIVDFQSVQGAQWESEHKARQQAKREAVEAATETCRVKVYGRKGQTVHTAAKVEGGKMRLVCGAQLWRSSLYSKTDEPVTCSRCMKRAGQ